MNGETHGVDKDNIIILKDLFISLLNECAGFNEKVHISRLVSIKKNESDD